MMQNAGFLEAKLVRQNMTKTPKRTYGQNLSFG